MTHREKKKKKKDKVNTPPPKQRPMQDLDDLLTEAKYGTLTTEELIYVAGKVKAAKPGDNTDLYGLLFILGLSGATQYRELVESYLYYPTDPMISGMALKALCKYWGEGKRYLTQMKAFIQKTSWSDHHALVLAALHCTSGFLGKTPDKELLQILLNMYEKYNAIVVQAGRYRTEESGSAKLWRDAIFLEFQRTVDKWDQLFGQRRPAAFSEEEFVLGVIEEIKRVIKTLK